MDRSLKPIYNVKGMAESARYTEYKDILSAASEIVDNSIEALADHIYIIVTSKLNPDKGVKEIKDIAFLDNGNGMHPDTLHGALSYGDGTRKDRKSIGRFGVGLAQASLFSAPRVDVYSWQNRGDIRHSYLDTNEMKTGQQEFLTYPESSQIPNEFFYYFNVRASFFKTGTLVIWRGVDKSPVKRASSLINRLDPHLGRIYRYYLNSERVGITLVDDDNKSNTISVKPRDPLFLMDKDYFLADPNVLGYQGLGKDAEPVFEPFTPSGYSSNKVEIEVPYFNSMGTQLTSKVIIKFSIVKEKFYSKTTDTFNNPGQSPIGKHIKDYAGISVLRVEREVDFDKFGFYDDVNNPFHRWWGVELAFDPALDEMFKISNNKQHIELKKPNQQERTEMEVDGTYSLWDKLNDVISSAISQMVKLNKERQKGARTKKNVSSKSFKDQNSSKDSTKENSKDENKTSLKSLLSDVVRVSNSETIEVKKLNNKGFKFKNIYSETKKYFSIELSSWEIEIVWDDRVLELFNIEEINYIFLTGFKKAYLNIDLSVDVLEYFIEIENVINNLIIQKLEGDKV